MQATGPGRPPPPEPSPFVVNPHVRLRERSEAERRREAEELGLTGSDDGRRGRRGGGGGGGGGGWQEPSTAPPPSRREVEAFRNQLEAEMPDAVDPDDDPCEQLRGAWGAGARASREVGARPDVPNRRELARICRELPEDYMRCMDRDYFREHVSECQREIARLARRGERRTEQARERLDELRR